MALPSSETLARGWRLNKTQQHLTDRVPAEAVSRLGSEDLDAAEVVEIDKVVLVWGDHPGRRCVCTVEGPTAEMLGDDYVLRQSVLDGYSHAVASRPPKTR